jgi:Family of unknown function (DUF6069)
MTPITAPTAAPLRVSGARPSLVRATFTSGLLAAAATTAVAAALHAAGVSFDVDGQIPLLAFAQMTLIGAVVGGLLAAGFRRYATSARQWFVRTAVALTALSCVPSLALPHSVATKLSLVVTHVVAAAIVVPVLARRLAD